MEAIIKIGISSCLLGEKVRYDGGHKLDRFLAGGICPSALYVPVCPEVGCGLPVPREPMRMEGDPSSPRLITIGTRIDHTERMLRWAELRLAELEKEGICGFIFKSGSPSSGMAGVNVYTATGSPTGTGAGLFAGALMERFPLLPVEDERTLRDPAIREGFIERISAFRRLIRRG